MKQEQTIKRAIRWLLDNGENFRSEFMLSLFYQAKDKIPLTDRQLSYLLANFKAAQHHRDDA